MHYFASQIDAELYEKIAKDMNVALVESEMDLLDPTLRVANDNVMLFQHSNNNILNSLGINACKAYIELDDGYEQSKNAIANANFQVGMFVSIKASTVYNYQVSKLITNSISRKISIGDSVRAAIKTALHEALAEVVISGCYEIEFACNDMNIFHRYFAEIEERNNDPHFANRRIKINTNWTENKIWFDIEFEGAAITEGLEIERNNLYLIPKFQRYRIIRNFASEVMLKRDGHELSIYFDRKIDEYK